MGENFTYFDTLFSTEDSIVNPFLKNYFAISNYWGKLVKQNSNDEPR